MDLFVFDSLELKFGSIDDDDDDTTTNTNTNTTPFNGCNWSELHEDLLELILKELATTSVPDCLRFGSVCVSWRSVLVPHLHPDLLHPQLPLLMIPSLPRRPQSLPPPVSTPADANKEKSKREEEETRSFYSLSERRVISEEDLKIKLPYNRYCRGCSYGWIITSGNEDTGFSVDLFNPLISINNEYQKIQLPPLTAFPYDPDHEVFGFGYLEKAVLSANPTTTADYVVMAIYSGLGRLGFWKPGNEVWTDVPIEWEGSLDDVIYHHNNGLFYLVNIHGEVMVCGVDDDSLPPTVRRFAPSPLLNHYGGTRKYLVESLGDLLMVHRFGNEDDSRKNFIVFKLRGENEEEDDGSTNKFIVFKLKLRGENKEVLIKVHLAAEWKLINTLPERMLFIGDNASMSLSASDFVGAKSSCIYFTDDDVWKWDVGFPEIGIFNMKNKTIEKLNPMPGYISPSNTIWVVLPTLGCCLHF